MFHFTALLGAQSDSPACQSLLELDNGIKILVDVGWDNSFDIKMLSELERHTPTIDLILLTHPTLEHMGAYAHACKHIPNFNSIPVYSTFPVSNLGRLLLQDIYLSTPKSFTRLQGTAVTAAPYLSSPSSILPSGTTTELPENALKLPPAPSEIDSYCGKIVTLKYSQPTPLHSAVARVAGKLGSVTITAYSAGHSLGGTIWKIQQAQESIVYAVDWNLSRENCLRGAAFLSGEGGRVQEALLKPTALVCSSKNATVTNMAGGRKKRDGILLDMIRKVAVQNGGTVLIPTDSVGRVLELAYLLEHAWRKDGRLSGKGQGQGISLYLAGRKAKRLGQVIGSMLEWMDEAVVREFESIAEKSSRRGGGRRRGDQDSKDAETSGNKAGPFDFLYLNLVSTPGQLAKALNNNDGRGKVIIASDLSLEWGFSRDALLKLANDDKNVVVLTERGEGKSGLVGRLWQGWKEATTKNEEDSAATGQLAVVDTSQEIENASKTPLEGEELLSYQRHVATRQTLTSQHQSLMSTSGLPSGLDDDQDDEDASSSSDDDSDSERQGKALTTAASKKISQATMMMGGAVPAGVSEKIDIGINILLRGEGIYDFDVRGAKGRNRMFPFQVRRKRIDEYGEVVRPDDYMRAEERNDEELADDEGERREETRVMGKKRKWDEEIPKPGTGGHKGSKGAIDMSKRRGVYKRTKGGSGNNEDGYDSNDQESAEEGEVSESSEGEDVEEALASPSKLTISSETVRIHISATFIDYAGLHDQKSLRMLLPLIDPKKLILIGGKREETKYLAEFYREKAALSSRGISTGTDVFFPQMGQKVNASVDTNAWVVKLGNTLSRGLKWQHARGLGVVHVIGRVAPEEEKGQPDSKKQKTITEEGEIPSRDDDRQLVLDVLPPALAAATRSFAQPIHVGDIRLADLRRVLQDEGHAAEFKGEGTLLVDGFVVVRKTGVGNVSVEDGGGGFIGAASARGKTFVQVRRKVYAGLAVVAGG
ncbi:beta-lactamase-like protein [Tricharina praecox]|uniref:beta-lactamase-like protein n=1 Tax=Tricharina praecox TaxID=43433 RepID=UPI002220493F|nr:beta-lactamase-like protein [Tricharina praecox]KAI5853835.1 beta-lactamase-like protein [Tricharina praecox]